MTDDEAVECYMDGWVAFIDDVSKKDGCSVRNDVTPTDPVQRGYLASRAAYEAAEKAERERLERCPTCDGKKTHGDCHGMRRQPCPSCYGTGRRTP